MLHGDGRTLELARLTPKERECLRLVAQNRSSKEIARELGISKASVDTYCNRARAKLGVGNRRAAARLAMATPAMPAEPARPATPVRTWMLPPLATLGPWRRLGLILGGAVVLALAFGMLVSGMLSLDLLASHIGGGHTR
jgi:DNA-binding CsgD family transcriptional regulator